jgi:phosphomannomutase
MFFEQSDGCCSGPCSITDQDAIYCALILLNEGIVKGGEDTSGLPALLLNSANKGLV